MRVKICGITNLQDALDAVDAKAYALGFVFYPKSPRYIKPEDAKQIILQLPPFIQTIGLFVNETAQTIDDICNISNVDLAQIHFEADEKLYKQIKTKTLRVIRAKNQNDILKYKDEYRLIDAFTQQYGGMGKRLNLEWFKDVDCSKIILAGGLNISNVKQLKGFNFYSVDISSGVELKKGIKDKQKMKEFVKAVNELSK
jgi:phosphoribosylanthranilate isomerase